MTHTARARMINRSIVLISKPSFFAFDDQFVLFSLFHTTYDAGIDTKALRDGHDLFGMFRSDVDLHPVTHVEHLIHFTPVRAALLLNDAEEGRNWEEIVFDHALVVYEVHHLGLCTTRTVDHTVDLTTQLVQQHLDHRRIRTGRREHQFACINAQTGNLVGQLQSTLIDQFIGNGCIITFRIFLCQIFGKYIVTG